MFKTLNQDRPHLENKYHRTDEPFNAFNRMAYHGWECDPETGMDDAEMAENLSRMAEELKGQPHPVAKAKAFAFVLDHMRIDVHEHDYFVGLYNWGRLLEKDFFRPWRAEMFQSIPEVDTECQLLNRTGAVGIWPDFDHVIPNWDDLMHLGFGGLLERVKKYHELHREDGSLTEEMDAFFTGIEISYEAILRLLDRLYRYALTKTHEKAALQTKCLKQLRDGAPETTYEVLQAIYIFFVLCECVDHYQTRSLGNGIDYTLYPFFRRDVDSGRFTKEEVLEFIGYFLMQYSAIGNYWGHPMYLGGTNLDGTSKVNELSYGIMKVYRTLGIYNPKIQIKVNINTPEPFVNEVLDMVRSGISSIVFCCEPGMQKAMMSYGASYEEAVNGEISGCYETRVRFDESSTATGYVNVLKAMSLTIHDGVDTITGETVGLKTGPVSQFLTFDDFYYSYLKQVEYLIEQTIWAANAFEPYLQDVNPSNVFSATSERCLKRGVDGYAKGMKFNNSAILCCGFGSAVDSLMAVKELVYDKKLVSFEELRHILLNNWEGEERLRLKALQLHHKYGNGDPEADRYAAAVAAWFSNHVNGIPNSRGGVYKAIMHSAMQFVWQGEKTEATPDGRKTGDEISKNASPVVGMDKNGVTALVRSASALKPYTFPESFCVDVMMHPSAVQGEDGLVAMRGVLYTYLKNDGMSIQFNVFHPDQLRDAQAHPEKYQNLQVRVCGWNVLWNNLSRKEQDAYILRAENITD